MRRGPKDDDIKLPDYYEFDPEIPFQVNKFDDLDSEYKFEIEE